MPHLIIYEDRKYLLIKVDRSNFAIVLRRTYERHGLGQDSLEGYYGTLKTALRVLIRLKNEERVLFHTTHKGTFTSLDVLVETYIKNTLTITQDITKVVRKKIAETF